MRIRKAILTILVLAAMSIIFAGCSSVNNNSSSESGSLASETMSGSGEESKTPDSSESEIPASSNADSSASSGELTGELGSIMQDIMDNATSKIQYIKDMTLVATPITAEFKQYYLGSADVQMAEGLALEPEISSPFSVCLVKVPDGADAESVKEMIKTTVDPQKWICMGVDPSKVIVEREGDIVILIMTDNGGPEIYEAFKVSFD
ncbi:MAG: hypothetical protein ACYC5K_10390 [Saccharofermentanales bacterium]